MANNRLKKQTLNLSGAEMPVCRPLGARNSLRRTQCACEIPLQAASCDLAAPRAGRELLDTAACWSSAVGREVMLKLKSASKEDIPCFRVLEGNVSKHPFHLLNFLPPSKTLLDRGSRVEAELIAQ